MSDAPSFDALLTEDEHVPPPVTRRSLTFGISLLATTLLVAGLAILPAPYAVRSPGPTEDTLGEQDGTPLISITGAETFDSTGELRLTTVSVAGGPGYPVNLAQVVQGWFDRSRSVRPVEEVFPTGRSKEETEQQGQAEMISSQENATVAALTELGYEVPATLTVEAAVPDSGSDGVVEPGDVIVELDGAPVPTYQDLIDGLAAVDPGADVTLGVLRDGAETDLTVTTTDGGDTALLGVFIDPTFDFPVDVTIQIEDIGGPSAGTMFALGIVDQLTPEDEANGVVIAGTGTMSVEGDVGPIGGIQQKLYGALRDGATWFLAPQANCPEVVGNVPDGLHVAAVSTLADARAAMEAIGAGEGDTLATCEARG
ncbi:PDZ domain-containing protein [Cellulosimicrobium cellulans]|uniref:Signal protein PDZ n=1 Tax=Cellulosimicrobium cellulans TaxID=1710 RepID=A0A1Y0HYZ5_CELCE|nr:PDZ domain-containing protein [Cellulosimicrobium cellulans]ARU52474.1 signal protein PDZ [Cellulosimicrobium cellulans]MBM7819123.1 PDZ domain-containing protein [Cellulosimicrobium cellulans]